MSIIIIIYFLHRINQQLNMFIYELSSIFFDLWIITFFVFKSKADKYKSSRSYLMRTNFWDSREEQIFIFLFQFCILQPPTREWIIPNISELSAHSKSFNNWLVYKYIVKIKRVTDMQDVLGWKLRCSL